jgi:hypothetical protein
MGVRIALIAVCIDSPPSAPVAALLIAIHDLNPEAGFTFSFPEAALLSLRSASIQFAVSRPISHSQPHYLTTFSQLSVWTYS